MKEDIKQITTEKATIKNQTDSLELKYNEINVKLIENESETSQLACKIDNGSEQVKVRPT